jgi:hypothetical protein
VPPTLRIGSTYGPVEFYSAAWGATAMLLPPSCCEGEDEDQLE